MNIAKLSLMGVVKLLTLEVECIRLSDINRLLIDQEAQDNSFYSRPAI